MGKRQRSKRSGGRRASCGRYTPPTAGADCCDDCGQPITSIEDLAIMGDGVMTAVLHRECAHALEVELGLVVEHREFDGFASLAAHVEEMAGEPLLVPCDDPRCSCEAGAVVPGPPPGWLGQPA